MADYRLSASVISRGKGQSALAAAAYRSGSRLYDARTGETHDYTRKGGVLHTELMAPEATPDWMQDRAQLWNAVEAVERRKDAQLSREITLSLPHELNHDQRLELVRSFAAEQFVARGMIADIAIHAPSKRGDERNHHAHIMLSMRELTGDGFGKKNRDWNASSTLEGWREAWAAHQNRALERHGHAARVDHRSYEDRGIDREPSQHLGPVANDMERKGQQSRIGDENREIAGRNTDRAVQQMEAARLSAQIAREQAKFGQWEKGVKSELETVQAHSSRDLAQKHKQERQELDRQLEAVYGRATLQAELDAVGRRLEKASGFRRFLRDIFGRTRSDKSLQRDLKQTIADVALREAEQRRALEQRQQIERDTEAKRQAADKGRLHRSINQARADHEAKGWKPSRPSDRPQRRANDNAQTPIPEPKTAEKNREDADKLEQRKGDLKRPWQSNVLDRGKDGRKPWESGLFGKGKKPGNGS